MRSGQLIAPLEATPCLSIPSDPVGCKFMISQIIQNIFNNYTFFLFLIIKQNYYVDYILILFWMGNDSNPQLSELGQFHIKLWYKVIAFIVAHGSKGN